MLNAPIQVMLTETVFGVGPLAITKTCDSTIPKVFKRLSDGEAPACYLHHVVGPVGVGTRVTRMSGCCSGSGRTNADQVLVEVGVDFTSPLL